MAVNNKEERKQQKKRMCLQSVFLYFYFCPDNDTFNYHLLDIWFRGTPYDEFSISVPIIYD